MCGMTKRSIAAGLNLCLVSNIGWNITPKKQAQKMQKIKGHYTRLDFGFESRMNRICVFGFFFPCMVFFLPRHMASKTDNYRHTKVSVSVAVSVSGEYLCECLPAVEASQETKLDKCHYNIAPHLSFHNTQHS